MKNLKRILFLITLFLINICVVSAKDDLINRIDVSITLDNFGNAHIEEIWDVKANMGTEFYKAEYNLGNMEISNFKVYENGREFTFLNDWDIDASLSEKAYKNGFNYTSDGIELCWGKGSMGNHTFKLTYDVSNFVFKTEDADVVYWQVINEGMTSVPKNFSLIVNGFYYFPDTLDVWGYGYKGYAYVNDGKIYMSNEENTKLDDGDYAVLLVKFPLNTFTINESNIYNDFNSFDEVLTRAEEGSFLYDYNNENILFDVIIPILFSFVFPLIFVFVVIFLANQSKYKFESLGSKIDYKNIHNFRDIPCKKDIFRAYFISQAYKLNKNEADFLGSIFLKWLFEGKIELQKQNNKDSVLTLDYNNVDEEVTSTLTEDLLSVSNASVAVCRMEDPTKFKIPTSVILTGANGSMTVSLTTQDTGTTASRILGSLSIPTDVKAGEYTGSFIVTYTY